MARAYVLFGTKSGSEKAVQDQIRNLKFVKETPRVFGVYVATVTIEFEKAEDITDAKVKIRKIEGMKNTTTMPVESNFTKET